MPPQHKNDPTVRTGVVPRRNRPVPGPVGPRQPRLSWRGIVIGIVIVVSAVVIWDAVKYRFMAKRWGVVEPGLVYRSGQISKWMIEKTLRRHGIGVIVDLTSFISGNEHQLAEAAAAKRLGIKHVRLPLRGDGTGDIRHYAQALKFLVDCQRAGVPVLIHCAGGGQRCGGVVFAYRTLVENQSPKAACTEMRRYGWQPGDGNSLPRYLNSHMDELAELLVENGVLEHRPQQLPKIKL